MDDFDWTGLLQGGAQIGAAYLPYEAGQGIIDYLKGQDPSTALAGVKTGVQGALDFTPYSVSTGFGAGQIGPQGQYATTLSPEAAAIQRSLLGQAQTAAGALGGAPAGYGQLESSALSQAQTLLGQQTPTAESLFQQMQSIQAPEQERQRLALENRLAAQGRLGTQTSMFGGTPEALALEKAIQEQQASSAFQAQQLAPQLAQAQLQQATGLFGLGSQAGMAPAQQQAAQIANLGGMLTTAFRPEESVLSSLIGLAPISGQQANIALGEAQALRDLGVAGIEAEAARDRSVGELEASRLRALSEALSAAFSSGSGGDSAIDALTKSIEDYIKDRA